MIVAALRRSPGGSPLARLNALAAALAAVVLMGCAAHAPRVREGFVPGLFDDLLVGTVLGRYEVEATRFRQAWRALETGDLRHAEREPWRSARPFPPIPGPAEYPIETALGALRLTAGDHLSAVRHFDRALALKPAYPQALVGLAAVSYLQGDDEKALDLVDQVLAVLPGHGGARTLRARAASRLETGLAAQADAAEAQGDLALALERLRRMAALRPDDLTLLKRLGAVALRAGATEDAVGAFREATRLDAEDVDAWIGLGEASVLGGDAESARAAYERASRLPGGLERAQERVRALRERVRSAPAVGGLEPPERALVLDRAGLATLIESRLPILERLGHGQAPIVVTDVSGARAKSAIRDVVATGVMEVYEDHTFRPEVAVTRSMLARTTALVLHKLRRAGLLSERRYDSRQVADVPTEHLAYPDVVDALRYGVMDLDAQGLFHPTTEVSGEEAAAVLERLALLTR